MQAGSSHTQHHTHQNLLYQLALTVSFVLVQAGRRLFFFSQSQPLKIHGNIVNLKMELKLSYFMRKKNPKSRKVNATKEEALLKTPRPNTTCLRLSATVCQNLSHSVHSPQRCFRVTAPGSSAFMSSNTFGTT